jgi:VIT1/CCC1 family predicted Fe2+/Mn2+ transporter
MPAGNKARHRTGRIGWLRAAVLGANDGILSTSSLLLGVAAAHATHSNLLVAEVAGLVAAAMSMAGGEYVSVQSQADTEQADLAVERAELKADDKGEHKELMAIYVARGLEPALAKQVAQQLMAHDAIGAHARDDLGISETLRARPIQAALASAGSFAVGAAMPLLITAMVPAAPLVAAATALIRFYNLNERRGPPRVTCRKSPTPMSFAPGPIHDVFRLWRAFNCFKRSSAPSGL